MGSGPRFDVGFHKYFSLGVTVCGWPHQASFTISLAFVTIYIGIGKGYDEQ